MPRSLYAELLGENGDLARRAEASRLRNMHANVVDELLGDQRLPLVRAVEELAHGNGGGAVLADLAEIAQVLGRERVLEKKHAERFGLFAELDGFVGREALVHVVEQFDLVAELVAADFEQLDRAAHLRGAIEERLVVQRLRASPVLVLRAVAGPRGPAHLHAPRSE